MAIPGKGTETVTIKAEASREISRLVFSAESCIIAVTFAGRNLTIRVRNKKMKGVIHVDDAKIIELFFQRNEQAVKETDNAYGHKLYRLSNSILNDPQDAEESVSDTYMETWRSIPPKSPKYFYAFLASICRHLSFNKLDWRLAEKRNAEVVALTQEMESCIPDARQEGEMDRRELRRILEAFLDSLSKESRLIFLRRYLYVDTVAEIALRYGISESKVKTQLHRTRNKLRTYLAKEGITV